RQAFVTERGLRMNKYLEAAEGRSLLPFASFIERKHPDWINKPVTQPLPLREGDDWRRATVQHHRGSAPRRRAAHRSGNEREITPSGRQRLEPRVKYRLIRSSPLGRSRKPRSPRPSRQQ